MTPRERAARIAKQWCATPDDFYECAAAIERAIAEHVAEHVRALLSDDMKHEIGNMLPEVYRHWGCIHAFVDALRKKSGV